MSSLEIEYSSGLHLVSETDISGVNMGVSIILEVGLPYSVSSKSIFVLFVTPSLPIFQLEEDC